MNRIKELRLKNEWLQKDLEEKLNLGRGNISRYEKELISLSPDIISRLCDIFGVTADYLLCRSDNPAPQVSPEDLALLQAYHASPAHIQEAARAMLQVDAQPAAAASPEARAAG